MYKNPFIMIHLVPTNDKKKKKRTNRPTCYKIQTHDYRIYFFSFLDDKKLKQENIIRPSMCK